jgi:hypothetical protein
VKSLDEANLPSFATVTRAAPSGAFTWMVTFVVFVNTAPPLMLTETGGGEVGVGMVAPKERTQTWLPPKSRSVRVKARNWPSGDHAAPVSL